MIVDPSIYRHLQDLMRQVLTTMADLNEMEKTVSRLRDELTAEYKKLDDRLDNDAV